MVQQRKFEIDIVKILSCIAVIIIHVSAKGVSDPLLHGAAKNAALFLHTMAYFAVPSFIFCSGASLCLSYQNKPISTLSFLKKRLNTLLVPYLVWSFIYYTVYCIAGIYTLDVPSILSVIFLGTGEYHLYFVVIILQLYIFFPLLKKALDNMPPTIFLGIVLIFHLGFSFFCPPFPYMDRFFVPYILFFASGMILGYRYNNFLEWVKRYKIYIFALYVPCLIIYFWAEYSKYVVPQLWQLFSLVSIVMLFSISVFLTAKFDTSAQIKKIVLLSTATFYVYLAHPLVIEGVYQAFFTFGICQLPLILPLNFFITSISTFYASLGYLRGKKTKTE